jgi:hypothetical protein
MTTALYFTASDGVVYRVLDVLMRDGRLRAGDPPTSWAKSRVFRPAEGWRRLYRFVAGESREPTAAELERQFAGAEYLETEAFDADTRQPR